MDVMAPSLASFTQTNLLVVSLHTWNRLTPLHHKGFLQEGSNA